MSVKRPAVDPPPAYQAGLIGSTAPAPDPALAGPVPVPAGPAPAPAPTSQKFDSIFKLLLTLVHTSKCVRTPNRKTKNIKPDSESKGPYDFSTNIEWDTFLDSVAKKLAVEPPNLVISSFEWHWLKPASGPWLPVQDENGFSSMLKKIKAKTEPYVIIRMQVPAKKKAAGFSFDLEADLYSDSEDTLVVKKVRSITYCHAYPISISCRQSWMTRSKRLPRSFPTSIRQVSVLSTQTFPVSIIVHRTCISTLTVRISLSGHRQSSQDRLHTRKSQSYRLCSRHRMPSNVRRKLPPTWILPLHP